MVESGAPVGDEYVPAAHFVQLLAPVAAAYVPAEQLVQAAAPAAEYRPTRQSSQNVEAVAPVVAW